MLLKNGNVFIKGAFKKCDLLIEEGRIANIGNLLEKDKETIDVSKCYIIPGMTDLASSIGLIEAGVKIEGDDSDETAQSCICDMYAIDGVYFEDDYFKLALANGITSVVVSSGRRSVIGAVSSLIKSNAQGIKDVIKKDIDIAVTFGEKSKKAFGEGQVPISRMGIVNIVRKNILCAKQYQKKLLKQRIDYQNYDPKMAALLKVINRQIPFKIYAQKKQDIETAISLKRQFAIEVVISGGVESYKLLDLLKKNNIPIILDCGLSENSDIETCNRRLDTAAILKGKGIPLAISTHHPASTIDLLHLSTCLACRHGLSESDAIEAVTAVPMQILGLSKERGTIERGKVADLVVFDKNPTYSLSRVFYTLIDGQIAYTNRQ